MPTGSNWVAAGPDGNLWFVELNGHIARVTTTGVVTDFPTPPSGNIPSTIIAGPDGAMRFSDGAQMIGRLTMSGVYTEYRLITRRTQRVLRSGVMARSGSPRRGTFQRFQARAS
jgi:streptogramin lyase